MPWLAPGARMTRVLRSNVRANYLNLRGAEIIDLAAARLPDRGAGSGGRPRSSAPISPGSDIDRLILTEAVLSDVDLRQAELVRPGRGGEHLRGATISALQLTRLAPAFAEQLGILVSDLTAPQARATATSRTTSAQEEKTGGRSLVLNRKTVFRSLPRMSFCA